MPLYDEQIENYALVKVKNVLKVSQKTLKKINRLPILDESLFRDLNNALLSYELSCDISALKVLHKQYF